MKRPDNDEAGVGKEFNLHTRTHTYVLIHTVIRWIQWNIPNAFATFNIRKEVISSIFGTCSDGKNVLIITSTQATTEKVMHHWRRVKRYCYSYQLLYSSTTLELMTLLKPVMLLWLLDHTQARCMLHSYVLESIIVRIQNNWGDDSVMVELSCCFVIWCCSNHMLPS